MGKNIYMVMVTKNIKTQPISEDPKLQAGQTSIKGDEPY